MKTLEKSTMASPMPARLDLIQSVSGLLLALFMWTHLLLVSSILLGKDAMWYLTAAMELKFLHNWQHGYPIVVSLIAFAVFALFIIHAAVAVRKFPASWQQHRIFRHQMNMMKHADTNLWYTQVVTGFVMFFLGSVHIYVMMSNPSNIGPYESADRFVTGWFWPLYLILLFAVELHAAIGMYRLAVKWGIPGGKDPRKTRKRLKLAKNLITVAFLTIGLLSFAAYMKIGFEHRDRAGERYVPASVSTTTPAKPERGANP